MSELKMQDWLMLFEKFQNVNGVECHLARPESKTTLECVNDVNVVVSSEDIPAKIVLTDKFGNKTTFHFGVLGDLQAVTINDVAEVECPF